MIDNLKDAITLLERIPLQYLIRIELNDGALCKHSARARFKRPRLNWYILRKNARIYSESKSHMGPQCRPIWLDQDFKR